MVQQEQQDQEKLESQEKCQLQNTELKKRNISQRKNLDQESTIKKQNSQLNISFECLRSSIINEQTIQQQDIPQIDMEVLKDQMKLDFDKLSDAQDQLISTFPLILQIKIDQSNQLMQQIECNSQIFENLYNEVQNLILQYNQLAIQETNKNHEQQLDKYTDQDLEMQVSLLKKDMEQVITEYKELLKQNNSQEQNKQEQEELNKLIKQVKDLKEENEYLRQEIQVIDECIEDIKGSVRICIRIRPSFLEQNTPYLQVTENNQLTVNPPKEFQNQISNKQKQEFYFDQIFETSLKQQEIYNYFQPLASSIFNQKNIMIFSYGPTGSGKTFTMMGDGTQYNKGLIPRFMEEIFAQKDLLEYKQIEILIDIREIYLDKIWLLSPQENQQIQSVYEGYCLISEAMDKRVVKKTEKNDQSSRSHLLFKITIKDTQNNTQGNLVLVDLSGSERMDHSKTTGESLKEGLEINKSLLSLKEVISAIASKKKHIPYRNSSLTHHLQQYFNSQTKVIMIANISQDESDYFSTMNTLKFANSIKIAQA